MELNPELLAVLVKLGATELEVGNLIDHYTSQLAAADGAVAVIKANIESLQVQLAEETGRADRIREGIAKFVVASTT